MKIWILEQLAKLPIWVVSEQRGRRKHEPFLGKVFIVTVKRIWFFRWTRLVMDVRYLDPKVEQHFLRLHAEKSDAPAPAGG